MGELIDGIEIIPLKVISVSGGDVLHAIKSGDLGYCGFGEVYFSEIKKNFIKGWKKHRKMQMNLTVPSGSVRFVIYDDREHSPTFGNFNDFILSRNNNYVRLVIPQELWVAFQGISHETSIVMNVASIAHDPTESEVRKLNDIEYNWE